LFKNTMSLRRRLYPYVFILPAAITIIGLLFYPISTVFYYSLQYYNIGKPFYNGYVGMDNFINIFTNDDVFYSSLLVSAKWVGSEVSLQLLFGLIIALLLNRSFKGRGLVRSLIFAPWAISGILTTSLWSMMFNFNIGVINDALLRIGLIQTPVAWLSNPGTVFASIVIAELWRGIPFFSIILLAALQSIPYPLFEAAAIDGAGPWRTFTKITLPYLKDAIILSTLLRAVWEFNNVDLIYTMTGGGPANMTTTLTMYVVSKAIGSNDFGYGSALAVIVFLLLLVVSVIYLKLSKFGREW